MKNVSPSTGGGLYLTFVSEDTDLEASEVRISDNQFTGNRANYGGGMFFLPLSECTWDSVCVRDHSDYHVHLSAAL